MLCHTEIDGTQEKQEKLIKTKCESIWKIIHKIIYSSFMDILPKLHIFLFT